VALDAVSSWTAGEVRHAARGARVEVLGNGIDAAWWRDGATPAGRDGATPAGRDGATPAGRAGSEDDVHVTTAIRLASRKRPLGTLAVLRLARIQLPSRVRLRATVVGAGPQHLCRPQAARRTMRGRSATRSPYGDAHG
ncbi:MAG: hypothetical protein ACRCYX_00600, partial [Dermatophilaceae bacterium]